MIQTAQCTLIALIAHDNMKPDILEWATYNQGTLARHELFATGTTGGMIAAELGLTVHRFRSGPLGGDQQVGAGVAEGKIDFIIFFWDPLAPHPHDVDVKALLRVAVVLQRADCVQPGDGGLPPVEPPDGGSVRTPPAGSRRAHGCVTQELTVPLHRAKRGR